MRVLLIDPFAGIAGDMFLGALLHAGAPLEAVREGLAPLGIELEVEEVRRGAIAARRVRVRGRRSEGTRGLGAVLARLEAAGLAGPVRERASAAFRRLAEAEAGVHGCSVEEVHFHEVGAADALGDVVGSALALEALGVERIHCRPLPLSRGSVSCQHGTLPLPAPAAMELMRGRPVFESGMEGELVTPTGAALVAAWAGAGEPPPFTPHAIGYGAGARDPADHPNVCRVVLGEAVGREGTLLELVCDVDDATPEVLGHLLGRLLEAGALDATLQPLVMKKGRPGTRVAALVRAGQLAAVEHLLFEEGTTLGVRRHPVLRTELPRRTVTVETPHGPVRLKIGELAGRVVHVAPEYEDCRRIAAQSGLPLREVARLALAQWVA